MSRVLIVDDVPITHRIIKNILGSQYDYSTAECGLSALDAYHKSFKREEPFDIIFLDILIPHKDGLDVLRHIREYEQQRSDGYHTYVIVITHLKSQDIENKAQEAGCDAFVRKPLLREVIMSSVEEVDTPA